VARLAQVKRITSLGVSCFSEAVLNTLLANGAYRKLVQRQRLRLKRELNASLQVLEDADWEVFGRPSGGLYIWARPRVCAAKHVRALAQRYGIALAGSAEFSPSGEAGDWLRINVAYAGDSQALAFFQACASADRPQAF
jgi:DNA-binding transcriptional MocR family regulator